MPRYGTLRGGSGRMGDSQGEGATRKGPWQYALHSPFFRGRMFWEERVCWQPDPPSGCGDLQRRGCWQLTSPLLVLGFFSHSHCRALPRQSSRSAPSSFRSTSSAIFKSLYTMHHLRRPRHIVCVGAWLHCAVALTSVKKKNNLRSCTASKWEQEPDG